jgi:hypothetical protein
MISTRSSSGAGCLPCRHWHHRRDMARGLLSPMSRRVPQRMADFFEDRITDPPIQGGMACLILAVAVEMASKRGLGEVGERSFSGRAISRPHTAIPSHMLRAANSSRRYAH